MSRQAERVTHQAVMFFDGGVLVKEMLHVEFEAVLDQVVGLLDFADRELSACFLRINQRQQILGVVFFLVDFDSRGFVNRSWNLPLQHLLDKAERGPDLGAGRIRFACRSRCPVAWHQRQLWDPVLEGPDSTLAQLQRAVLRNRLGLPVESLEEVEPEAGNSDTSAPLHAQLSALQGRYELQLAALKSEQQQEQEALHQHYRIQVNQLRSALESAKQLFRNEKQRSRLLAGRLEQQVEQVRRAREESEAALSMDGAGQGELAALRHQFELEQQLRVEQVTAELHEMLDMRDVELFYREEQLGGLREEVSRLRQERESLINRSTAHLLELLAEHEMSLMIHPSSGATIAIPAADLARYLDDPERWLAEYYGIPIEHYTAWCRHLTLPVCRGDGEQGSCGEPVEKIDDPVRFLPGHSDCCERHRLSGVIAAVVS